MRKLTKTLGTNITTLLYKKLSAESNDKKHKLRFSQYKTTVSCALEMLKIVINPFKQCSVNKLW